MSTYSNEARPGTIFDYFDCNGTPLVLADSSDGPMRALVVRHGRWVHVSVAEALYSPKMSEHEWRQRFWPQLARAGDFKTMIYVPDA